ncbi:hypothetical protein O181_078143 [Austropuccinia psidii MF-1]|uniref:Reverse transcriptase/retrotransposon-derived protein RNase H-like domain-containing protein n=1 Tax=Austropuccinia psidii MF-1 TaxID=1389203 RepID=A0A9Q3FE69_9BASI|nr:hypothetical protein [Austropuccinia psidii MF-1]
MNSVTMKNRYPVPPMNQLLTIFNGSTIFSKIDLCGTYNLLRIKEGDWHLTSLRTKYGSYEYLVIPFGLTNAPAPFQNAEEHVKKMASVLQRLRDNNWFAKASKTSQLINISLALPISIVVSLKITQKITAVTSLLKKDSPFIFNEEALSQFQIRKEAFTTSPILSPFHPSLPAIVETDASYYALGALLSQVHDSGKHPIEFYGRKLLPADLNYETHDKEILCIVWALNC